MGKKKKYRRKPRASGATAFVIKVGLICCLLLLVNAAICQVLVVLLRGIMPNAFEDPRMIQASMFFGPILLILMEFWFYDRRVDYLARQSPIEDRQTILGDENEPVGENNA